jgi:hypothetical protein
MAVLVLVMPSWTRVAAAAAPSTRDSGDDSPYRAALAAASRKKAPAPSPKKHAKASAPTSMTPTDYPPEERDTHPPRYFLRAGAEATMRDFEDSEPGPGSARRYHAFPIPAIAVGAEAYPLFGILGLDGAFAESLGVTSTTSERKSVGTTYLRAEGALRGRIPFSSRKTAPWLSLLAGYGYTRYSFDAAPSGREVPTARYHALRFGADTRIPVKRFFFTGGAEFDHVVSIAKLGTSRAHAPGNGVTARLGTGVTLTPWLATRLDARYAWVTYDFVRKPSATGTDQYVTLALAVEVLF